MHCHTLVSHPGIASTPRCACVLACAAATQEAQALAVGLQEPAPDRDKFDSVEDCLSACDAAGDNCVGVTVLSTVIPAQIPKICAFVKADTEPGTFKRTVIRADLKKLTFPSAFLWPSGTQGSGNYELSCSPITTPQIAVMVLTGLGTCDAATIEAARTAFLNFLSDPSTVFGECILSPHAMVSCSPCLNYVKCQHALSRLALLAITPSCSARAKRLATAVAARSIVCQGAHSTCTTVTLCSLCRCLRDPAGHRSGLLRC